MAKTSKVGGVTLRSIINDRARYVASAPSNWPTQYVQIRSRHSIKASCLP